MNVSFQVALKRQQAAEDAIALHLAAAESGKSYEYLPPGRIYGMSVTSPCSDDENDSPPTTTTTEKPSSTDNQPSSTDDITIEQFNETKPIDLNVTSTQESTVVSQASLDLLSKLFPQRKRTVLELVLKRCNHDLLKTIEHFNASQISVKVDEENPIRVEKSTVKPTPCGPIGHTSAFKPVRTSLHSNSTPNSSFLPLSNFLSLSNPSNPENTPPLFMSNFYPFLPMLNTTVANELLQHNSAFYFPNCYSDLSNCTQCNKHVGDAHCSKTD